MQPSIHLRETASDIPLTAEDLRCEVFGNNPASPFYKPARAGHLLKPYFHLRYQEFTRFGMNYYPDGPEAYDQRRDTVFILVLDKHEEVHGGRRILVHEPNSGTKLKTETTIVRVQAGLNGRPHEELISVRDQLSHLWQGNPWNGKDVEEMRYAELASVVFAPDIRKLGFLEALYRETFRVTTALDCDFLVTEAVPHNLARLIPIAQQMGAQQVVCRMDNRSNDGDEDFRTYFSWSPENVFPLVTEEMKRQGIGVPPTEVELEQLIARRKQIIAARHQRNGQA